MSEQSNDWCFFHTVFLLLSRYLCFYLSLYLDITLFDKYTPERRQGRAQCPQCRLSLPDVGAQPQPELPATDKLYFILISVFPNTLDFLSIFQKRIHSSFYLFLYFQIQGIFYIYLCISWYGRLSFSKFPKSKLIYWTKREKTFQWKARCCAHMLSILFVRGKFNVQIKNT